MKPALDDSAQTYPSIFNDVIGPAMRGPSSSHCAAAVRIGRMIRDLMDGEIQDVLIEFDPDGSLATTHESQGTDMGLFSGFLGWDATDERLTNSPRVIQEAGINVKIEITPIDAGHPNTYKMTITNSRETHTMTAISTGAPSSPSAGVVNSTTGSGATMKRCSKGIRSPPSPEAGWAFSATVMAYSRL